MPVRDEYFTFVVAFHPNDGIKFFYIYPVLREVKASLSTDRMHFVQPLKIRKQ